VPCMINATITQQIIYADTDMCMHLIIVKSANMHKLIENIILWLCTVNPTCAVY